MSVILTESNFDSFVKSGDKGVAVDFYDPDHNNDKEFELAAKNLRNMGCKVPFGKVDVSNQPALGKKFVTSGSYPQMLWFRHGEPTQYHRTLRTAKPIIDFVLALDRDPMIEIKAESEIFQFNRAIYAQIAKKSKTYKSLEVVGSRHMDTVAFNFLDTTPSSYWSSAPPVNISYVSKDANGVLTTVTYDGDTENVDALEKWTRSLLIRSEPLPEQTDGDSRIIVSNSFEEEVLRPDGDTFLMIYAPWCGFSRKFLPTWEKLTRRLAHVPHLVVAKLDGDANDPPLPEDGWSWDAYPTVFYARAGTKTPFVFKGNRTIERLVAFANEHGSKPITLTETFESDSEL